MTKRKGKDEWKYSQAALEDKASKLSVWHKKLIIKEAFLYSAWSKTKVMLEFVNSLDEANKRVAIVVLQEVLCKLQPTN